MIERLASQMGRNDEEPNIELAELLCQTEDQGGIREIVDGMKCKDKAIASDSIKVLYEVGERKPALVAEYADDFLGLLSSRNNRLVWGGMTALAAIADLAPDAIYKRIDLVVSAFEIGSAITLDNGMTALAKVCRANREYESHLMPVLLGHLRECRPSDVARHAERMSLCINEGNVEAFLDALDARRGQLADPQSKRVKKLEAKLSKQFACPSKA